MRNVLAAVLAVLPLICANALAEMPEASKRTLPHQQECAVPLPEDFWDADGAEEFRLAEEWAWNERICLGEEADMRYAPDGSDDGEDCAPAEIEETGEAVPNNRKLRPEFLELILSHEPWASVPRLPEAAVSCALVDGDLRLDDHEINPYFGFYDGRIDGEVSLLGAEFKNSASLAGSTVTGLLSADRLKVGGGLFLDNGGSFAGIDLLGARIEGSVSLDGSTVTGLFDADRLEVGGGLFLRDGGSFAGIDLLGARIEGQVALDGSTVTGPLRADRLEAAGSLFLNGGDFAGIDLPGGKIEGDVSLSGSTVTGPLRAAGLEVGGSLFLNGGDFAGIDLLDADIGGSILLSGGSFSGEFDLTGAAIGGELHLSSGWHAASPIWRNDASLILRNTKADVLQARKDGWNMSDGSGLLPTDLTGFTFNRLAGLDRPGGAGMGDESADWLVGWIEAQRDHGGSYDPQPYVQLAQALEAGGAAAKARAVRYARFEHKRRHDDELDALDRAGLATSRLFLGYGVHPFRLLYWFAGLVMLGWLFTRWSRDSSVRGTVGLWYSLENALPLIETSERFKRVEHGRPWLAHAFHAQKALGFVLAAVLVGALAWPGG